MNPEFRDTTRNKPPATVRNRAARAAWSQGALHDALRSLMQEKQFDDITVSELVRRAGVGRTTFYAHYQDSTDLLLASFVAMLGWMTERLATASAGTRRLLPIREFFEHVASAKPMLARLASSEQLPTLWRLAALHFAKSIEARVGGPLPARFAAGAMIETLQWWLDQRDPPSAVEVDRDFHALLSARMRGAGRPLPG